MSDRVLFATNNDAQSGFNGLPFPTPEFSGAVGAGTEYPVAMSLEELIALTWRWKKAQSTFDITINTYEETDGEFTERPVSPVIEPSDHQSATRERDICFTGQSFGGTGDTVGPAYTTISGYQYSADVSFDLGISGPDGPVVRAGNVYYVGFTLSGTVRGASYAFGSEFADINSMGDGMQVGNLTLQGDGISTKTIPIHAAGSAAVDVVNLDVQMKCIEYWPYATKPTLAFPDGQPVYNTTTGAQIRDPLS